MAVTSPLKHKDTSEHNNFKNNRNPRECDRISSGLAASYLLHKFKFSSALLHVHVDREDCLGREAQDGHLDFHTASS